MPKKYEHIEILEEGAIFANKIRITYEDGSVEVVEISPEKRDKFNECYDHLIEFAKQEDFVDELGITDLSGFLKSGKVTKNLIEDKKTIKEPTETAEYELDESHEEFLKGEEESNKKETKGKKRRFSLKRIGAWLLAILMGGGLMYGGIQIGKRLSNKANRTNHFVQIIDTPEYDNLTYEEKLALLYENSDIVTDGLYNMVNGNLDSSKDLDQCIENLANISLENINEISDYITGRTSNANGKAETTDLRFLFDEKTIDFCAVDYFNDLRDDIVNSAYTTKSVSQTKTCVTKFNEEFVNFVFGGKPLPYNMNGNTVYYTFDSLNPSAQMTILIMGITELNIEHDFNINVGGVEYNRMVALEEAYKLNDTIYQELLKTQKFTKTK